MLVGFEELFQSGFQIFDFGRVFPVAFSGKVQRPPLFPGLGRRLVEPQAADVDASGPAVLGVPIEHFREAELEFQGNAGAHHAVAVDGVNEGLGLAGKDVAGFDVGISQRTSSRRHQPEEYLGCRRRASVRQRGSGC